MSAGVLVATLARSALHRDHLLTAGLLLGLAAPLLPPGLCPRVSRQNNNSAYDDTNTIYIYTSPPLARTQRINIKHQYIYSTFTNITTTI